MKLISLLYNKINWQNSPSTSTPINAMNLGKMDKGIDDITKALTDNNVSFNFGYDGTDYGYYKNGESTLTPFRSRHTGTYKPTSRASNNDMGLYHTNRYVDTTAVPNANSGTYTPTTRGAAIDMGANNTVRYINTNNVPNTYSISGQQSGGFYNNNSISFNVSNGSYYIVSCLLMRGWSNANAIPTPAGCSVIGTLSEVWTTDSGFEGYYSGIKTWLVKATSSKISLTGNSSNKGEYRVTIAKLA